MLGTTTTLWWGNWFCWFVILRIIVMGWCIHTGLGHLGTHLLIWNEVWSLISYISFLWVWFYVWKVLGSRCLRKILLWIMNRIMSSWLMKILLKSYHRTSMTHNLVMIRMMKINTPYLRRSLHSYSLELLYHWISLRINMMRIVSPCIDSLVS